MLVTERTHPMRRRHDELASLLSAEYLDAICRGDAHGAEAALRKALSMGIGPATAFTRVVQPALEQVGADWERGELSVAQEHIASGISQRALASIYPMLIEDAVPNGIRVLLASVAGQLHSIGLRAVSDILEGAGFDSTYLGSDTPIEAIVDAVERVRPHVVGLSLTMPQDLAELELAVVAVTSTDPTVSVMLGGRGIPEDLRTYAGYVRDAESVVAVTEGLIAAGPVVPPVPFVRPDEPRGRVTSASDRHLASVTSDLANLARQQARRANAYRAMALTDAITGLPTRRAWDERFAAAGEPLSILVLDLDRFKAVNDRGGHLVGDALLKRVGGVVRDALRGEDFAARLGGDEFGVLLPLADRQAAAVIADRTREAVARAFHREGVTVTIGVAEFRGDQRACMLAADEALYRAKAAGGNRVEAAD
ncbi:diguanylate cyclase [Paraconexibacter sp.]|uniref:diguanylate cyclase n=1 Tax=Paraconexibacter sp. TaxID=2949640 RepID=UPI00356194A4